GFEDVQTGQERAAGAALAVGASSPGSGGGVSGPATAAGTAWGGSSVGENSTGMGTGIAEGGPSPTPSTGMATGTCQPGRVSWPDAFGAGEAEVWNMPLKL